jgi:hypothetical protein
MSSVKEFLLHPLWGLPTWGWLVLVVAMLVNEIFSWTKKTKAQSTLQALVRLVLKIPVVGAVAKRVPVVGFLLKYLAGPDPEGVRELPAEPKPEPDAAAGSDMTLLVLFVALPLLGACKASPYDVAVAFKTASSESLTITMNGFATYDREHQKTIAETEGSAGLKRYRTEIQIPMRKGVETAKNALSLLSAAIDAAKAGMEQNWGQLTAEVLRGFAEITEIITRYALPVKPPSVTASSKEGP